VCKRQAALKKKRNHIPSMLSFSSKIENTDNINNIDLPSVLSVSSPPARS
jgi:hypothetical protein